MCMPLLAGWLLFRYFRQRFVRSRVLGIDAFIN
jgi:hypothetical protein